MPDQGFLTCFLEVMGSHGRFLSNVRIETLYFYRWVKGGAKWREVGGKRANLGEGPGTGEGRKGWKRGQIEDTKVRGCNGTIQGLNG